MLDAKGSWSPLFCYINRSYFRLSKTEITYNINMYRHSNTDIHCAADTVLGVGWGGVGKLYACSSTFLFKDRFSFLHFLFNWRRKIDRAHNNKTETFFSLVFSLIITSTQSVTWSRQKRNQGNPAPTADLFWRLTALNIASFMFARSKVIFLLPFVATVISVCMNLRIHHLFSAYLVWMFKEIMLATNKVTLSSFCNRQIGLQISGPENPICLFQHFFIGERKTT